jgi:MYXO-CTERM domain-containing protein
MRKTIVAASAALTLAFGGAGVAHAADTRPVAQQQSTSSSQNDNGKAGLWGLLGLLGLGGLAGLRRDRDRDRYRGGATGTGRQ